ncbi:MAG TPA: CHRD domain-containing protein [Candidatus Angelobacter sp.]|nr:CHRD domain-containing protein [Candidatus Angelobacter sp.]
MKKKLLFAVLALLCISAVIAVAAETEKSQLRAKLTGIEEANGPSTVITDATGTFRATINDDSTITYTLTYANLSSAVQQAHIHIGATKLNGGVSIFLCSNLANPPAGTPACPDDATHSGSVSRTVSAADVIGPANQGVGVGDMADVVRAIASHVTYANVHTANHPGGEIRGQIRQRGDDDDDNLPGAR